MSKPSLGRRWFLVVAALGLAEAYWAMRQVPPAAARAGAEEVVAVEGGQAKAPAAPAPSSGRAATGSRPVLFTYARPANAAALDAALPAPAKEIHYVRLNRAWIAGKQSPFWQPAGRGRVELPLPDGGTLAVVIDESEMLGADRFTSTGHVEGRPESRAVFAYHRGFLHASIEDAARGNFALRAATEDLAQFYRIDPTLLAPCGGPVKPVIDAGVIAAAEARRARQIAGAANGSPEAAPPGTAAAENPQRPEVHVMMAYTTAVLPTLSGASRVAALQSAFDAVIAKMNSALDSSLVTARVRLVRIVETGYSGDGPSGTFASGLQDAALVALRGLDDGQMDELHAARDQSGADVVMLALNRRDTSSVGLSYVLESPSTSDATLTANFNPLFAFAVVEYSAIAGSNVVPHELGHVFGCAHARGDSGATGVKDGAFTYSYGYRFFGANGFQYHDIMAYFPGTELSYFSNPGVTPPAPVSRPIGIARGLAGEADAARTIEQTAFEVAAFRLQTFAAANPGTLINVSTRAFVGTGDNVLIGGFVVNGTQSKRMLIRAAGPELVTYGVTNPLVDPVLKIFSGSTQIAGNDNWGVQAAGSSAAEVAAAAAQSGGFPFPAGSADAALIVTLPPGGHTAIVEGKAGATGSGLVEVYDLDRVANKVVNLSTRGFADINGREMFGGFVILGAPGTTKRVLVRVLGPTLSRAPFNMSGTLDDPFMELYDAAGELLLQNDDWSTGAEGTPSAENDFRPTVTYYGEQKIAATGHAPTNRREPCMMLDLAPGNYTVIVKPFEFRHPDPDLDQPAKAGVGIVEVYEIDP